MQQLDRKYLVVNGVPRAFVYDPEADSLAECLRRIGLTGTKGKTTTSYLVKGIRYLLDEIAAGKLKINMGSGVRVSGEGSSGSGSGPGGAGAALVAKWNWMAAEPFWLARKPWTVLSGRESV